jgi:2-oxoisovalerate dehydrogenase E1 component
MPTVVQSRIDRESLLALYRRMLLIRRTEEQLARSHQRGLIHGACHTYVGQEAIAVGVCAHLRTEDTVFSTHRGHGHALAKGLEPRQLIAELYGREPGCSHGRGGSMHLFAPEIGLMGTSGIVGPCILQAAGAGYSFKLLKSDRVAVAFFGDGAVNNGAFHEGLNLAGIYKLPVIFVCENNQFATEVPFEYAAGSASVADRGPNYGMPGVLVDGNDVLAVHDAAGKRWPALAPPGRPCWNAEPTAHGRMQRAWATSLIERVKRWRSGKLVARFCNCAIGCSKSKS